jgi:hypothetical protein
MEGMNMTSKIKLGGFVRIATLIVGFLTLSAGAWADGEHPHPEHDLAKASQNPVAKLISVPFENNATFNNGTEDVFVNILNIKPVIPMGLTENWNLINRAIVPVIYQEDSPNDQPGEGSLFGLGDIIYQGFFSPAKPGKFIWGVGPELHLPTGMERLTTDQWSLGPVAVGLTMPGHWVIGALVSNVWSIGGYNDAPDVNVLTAQYFINYNMKGGWYLSSAPVITANWEAEDNDDTWTIPFGGGVGRVFKIGKQPVNLKLAAYYSVEKPDNASDWNLQFSWTFLFPK